MKRVKSIVAIIVSWFIWLILVIAYGMIFPQSDDLTSLATGYALLPFVSIAVFAIFIAYSKMLSSDKWFCIIIFLILLIWAIAFLKAFFVVYDGVNWNVMWLR